MPLLSQFFSDNSSAKTRISVIGATPKEVLFLLKMMDILIQLLELEEVDVISSINSKNIFKKIDRFDDKQITPENLNHYIVNMNNSQSMVNIKYVNSKLNFLFNILTFGHIQLIFKLAQIVKDTFDVEEYMRKDAIILKLKNNDENVKQIDKIRNFSNFSL